MTIISSSGSLMVLVVAVAVAAEEETTTNVAVTAISQNICYGIEVAFSNKSYIPSLAGKIKDALFQWSIGMVLISLSLRPLSLYLGIPLSL